MYYLELIDRFWLFNQNNQIGSTAVAMYFFLLKTGYLNDRYDFRLSDVAVSRELSLTRKTVGVIREKLMRFGLIEFRTRNGVPCHYRLVLNYPLKCAERQVSIIELLYISDQNEGTDLKMNKDLLVDETEFGDMTASPENHRAVEEGLPALFKSKHTPSFDEFLGYAQKLENYNSDLNQKIREKYKTWSDNGWMTGINRPITSWQSSLKSALPFMLDPQDSIPFSPSKIPVIKRVKGS